MYRVEITLVYYSAVWSKICCFIFGHTVKIRPSGFLFIQPSGFGLLDQFGFDGYEANQLFCKISTCIGTKLRKIGIEEPYHLATPISKIFNGQPNDLIFNGI